MNAKRNHLVGIVALTFVTIPLAALLLPVLSVIGLALLALTVPLLVIIVPVALFAIVALALGPSRKDTTLPATDSAAGLHAPVLNTVH